MVVYERRVRPVAGRGRRKQRGGLILAAVLVSAEQMDETAAEDGVAIALAAARVDALRATGIYRADVA